MMLTIACVTHPMAADRQLQNPPLRDRRAEQHRDDAHHRLRHPSQNEAVHKQPKIDRLKSAQKCRRFSSVAKLDQLDVRQHLRPPPIAREKENRHHAAHA
jgi:hypothetical protein